MRANPDCLILEDDPETLRSLQVAASASGFCPVASRSAHQALTHLGNNAKTNRPVLAIIDRDMTMAPDQSRSSLDVLRYLFSDFRECMVVVYSANIDSVGARGEVQRAHPRAWLHDKRDRDEELFERVRRMVSPVVGDLTVEDGAVLHMPSREVHHHRVGVSLLIHHPKPVTLFSEAMTRAARRFSEWLDQRESTVSVAALGSRKYGLVVKD